MGLLCGYVPPS
uniref:Uncharacterized protein n=1 Tax=Arundo donax TaxID=35708 RepID=A0A0A8Z1Y7_ARUDO